jgi:hypothetical protein
MLWMIGVRTLSGDRVVRHLIVVGDRMPSFAGCACEGVGGELVAVDIAPALLGGGDQLVGRRERCVRGPGVLRHAGAQLDGREAALGRFRGGQMPMLGRKATPPSPAANRGRACAMALGHLASHPSRKRSRAARASAARRLHHLVRHALRPWLRAPAQRIGRSCAPSGAARRPRERRPSALPATPGAPSSVTSLSALRSRA